MHCVPMDLKSKRRKLGDSRHTQVSYTIAKGVVT